MGNLVAAQRGLLPVDRWGGGGLSAAARQTNCRRFAKTKRPRWVAVAAAATSPSAVRLAVKGSGRNFSPVRADKCAHFSPSAESSSRAQQTDWMGTSPRSPCGCHYRPPLNIHAPSSAAPTRTWNRRGVVHYSLAGGNGVWPNRVFRVPTISLSTPGFISDAYVPASGVGLTPAPT